MKITVPFYYLADVKAPIALVDGRTVVFDHITLDIRELTSAEAPTALCYREVGQNGNSRRRQVRYADGMFFADSVNIANRNSPKKASAIVRGGTALPADLISYVVQNEGYPKTLGDHAWSRGRRAVEEWWRGSCDNIPGAIGPLVVTVWRDDARQRAMDTMRGIAAGLLIVDGNIHYRTSEPKLGLSNDGSMSVKLDFRHAGNVSPFARDFCLLRMNLNELDAARQHARWLATGGEPREHLDDLEVHTPEAFVFDTVGHHAMLTARDVVHAAGPHIGGLSREAATAWMRLREAFDNGLSGDVDSETLVALCAGLATHGRFRPDNFKNDIELLSRLVDFASRAHSDPFARRLVPCRR